jgi:pimeloyl-ACP methyl ester carboxylesterase
MVLAKPKRRRTRVKKPMLTMYITIAIIALGAAALFGTAIYFYNQSFGSRYTTYAPTSRSIAEFAGLTRERLTFTSNRGQTLVGYMYSKTTSEGKAPKGMIVIAHGLGGGHISYLDVADYFCSHGYLVFAYDATGHDESEGKAVGGIPQGLIDLDYALRFLKQNPDTVNLPIMLFGHSWGAYSVGSVLNYHPDVKAVVMAAGFNRSLDIIAEAGRGIVGKAIKVFLPFISIYEQIEFGSYAAQTCLQGFANSTAEVMIISSAADEMISSELSFGVFHERLKDDPRFEFIEYTDRRHARLWYSDEARNYQKEFNEAFAAYASTLEHGLTAEIKAEYIAQHLDKSLFYELDEALMARIVSFYDRHAR